MLSVRRSKKSHPWFIGPMPWTLLSVFVIDNYRNIIPLSCLVLGFWHYSSFVTTCIQVCTRTGRRGFVFFVLNSAKFFLNLTWCGRVNAREAFQSFRDGRGPRPLWISQLTVQVFRKIIIINNIIVFSLLLRLLSGLMLKVPPDSLKCTGRTH